MTCRSILSSLTHGSALGVMSLLALSTVATVSAQIPGRNVNMVSGRDWPGGDPFLQRQNEPSLTASTRNSLHLVGGSNDYRTVDLPGLPDGGETGDAWLSIYKSFDGGQRWASTLLPGFPQDTSPEGMASPIKGYQAAADPVVRAGTSGLIYYNGLVFDRGDNGRSGIFLARFIDRNNKENGDPINYLGTTMVAQATGSAFLDKPWMAVDIPRGNYGFCRVGGAATTEDDDDKGRGGKVKRNGQKKLGREEDRRGLRQPPDDGYEYVAAGAVYLAYSSITGSGATLHSDIFLRRSVDCGATWSAPIRVSSAADPVNQGATIAIDPRNGHVYVAWRRFATASTPDSDAIMVARLPVGGGFFDPPGRARGLRRVGAVPQDMDGIFEHRGKTATPPAQAAGLSEFDQGTSDKQFRSNAYPTMVVDGDGRLYVAWTERGFSAARPDPLTGDSRIMISTSTDGRTFTTAAPVDESGQYGHQLMPSLALAGGKLMLAYYDVRDTKAQVFTPFISDADSTTGLRQTIDIRAALGTLGPTPSFAPSVRVSDYLMGARSPSSPVEQLQVNPPNLPMFKKGTVPFIGDYIDLAPAPAFVPTSGGGWAFNTAATAAIPVFHAAWTDNRDVRPPVDHDWTNYTPPGLGGGSASLFDPTKTAPVCVAGNAGSRNQNIYTARIGGGLVVGAPGNAKQLSPTVQRGFVVFAQNQTTLTRTFRMTILAQPTGGRASFDQFPRPPYTVLSPAPRTFVDVRVPPRSTASRTIYATTTDPKAQLSIDVLEVASVGGGTVAGGLTGRALLNPDIANPDIANPDIANPDIVNPDIANAEVYNPDIANPDIANPDIANPDIANPDIANPDIANISVANPDIANPDIANPDIANPDIANPDIANPDIANPDIANGAISDISWTVSNIGNTTSAFNANLFVANAALSGLKTQLIVYKTYQTPVVSPNGCEVKLETRNQLLFSVPNPNLITSGQLPDQNDPSEKNATLWLNPGEIGRITLRVFDNNKADNVTFTNLDGSTASIDPRLNPATVVTAAISAQGVDVLDPPGATKPPAVTTTGTNLFYLQQPSNTIPGAIIAPPVRVRVWDNTGAPLPGVLVTIGLQNPPVGVLLSGTTAAVADAAGIATFANLSVNVPANGLRLRATGASAGVVAAGTSAPFNVVAPVSYWSASGSGTVTLLNNGATGTPAFSYDNPGVFTGAWTLSKVATATETVNLAYAWNGFHSYFMVTTGLDVFINRGGTDVYVRTLVNEPLAGEGPVVCCAFPSGGFTYAGATAVSVQAGDTYGFRLRGSHSDGTLAMNGTVSVVVGGTPQFTVRVRGTAGGYENQTPGFGPSSVPARVYGGTLSAGQQVTIAASGLVQRGAAFAPNGPGGTGPGLCDGTCLLAGAPIASLLARVGGGPWQLVGAGPTTLTAASAGLLEFAVNDNFFTDNTGAFQATVVWGATVTPTVTIGNWAQIYDGTPRPVSVTTVPPGLSTAVTYNGSSTAPSAIGAYTVVAIATGPGYLGRASVNETVASTVSAGGPGGGPFPASGALSCAPGVLARGVRASNTSLYGLGSGQLICSSGSDPARFVAALESPAPTYTDVTCGPGEVMVGLHGTTFNGFGFTVVSRIGAQCQSLSGGAITNAGPVGGAGGGYPGDAFSLTCPSGQAVTGVVGGAGEVVDSIALVCAPVTGITSAAPTTLAAFQYVTLLGTGLPASSAADVLFSQGGPEYPSDYLWTAGPTMVIARVPTGVLANGPATVRLKNAANTVSTNLFPITIAGTPGAPVLLNIYSGATPTTTLSVGQAFTVEADGTGSAGTTFYWTQGATVISQSAPSTSAGPTGRVGTAGSVPAGVTPGSWTLTVTSYASAPSNGIAVTVVP